MENPKLIKVPFANEDLTKITDFPVNPTSDEVVSQSQGWKEIYSQPLAGGGKAPERNQFNGLFNWLTTLLFFTQKGFVFRYDENQDYYAPAIVWDEGELYLCRQDVSVGNTYHKPSTDVAPFNYWISLKEYFKQSIPVNEKTITIKQKSGNSVTSVNFNTNEANNKELTLPDIGGGILTIKYNGQVIDTFSANSNENKTVEISADLIPIGTVQAFAGTNLPSGWLWCDGNDYSTTDYAQLFAVIGYKFGGSGSTFKTPNLAERFIEGTNGTPGIYKDAGLPNITGTIGTDDRTVKGNSGCFYEATRDADTGSTGTEYGYRTYFDASKGGSEIYGKSNTVQPKSITMKYIIKAVVG